MPRIPTDRIESIKRDVSIRAVLEARGCAFVKHGPDWACSCPLGTHADSSPSFVVSERKNLWRCHGCGQGGDVLALVQRLNGVSFRHAVELLAAGLPGLSATPTAAAPVPAVSTRRLLPCPLDAGADDARLADQVVGYYHQRLMDPGNAGLAYLARRGLGDLDFLRRFAFGFADRSLGLRLPAKNRAEGARLRSRLESLGWFRASGHEHLAGSIVVPIHGGAGEIDAATGASTAGTVVGAYGRKILDNLRAGTPAHLYLSGTHRGVWNHGPDLIDADGAVVVCEALLDAASVWIAGQRAVTAAYGCHGWTDDHDTALRLGRARSVFLAFDADAAGDAGAAALAERLISRGLSVFRVHWPAGLKDANAVVTDRAHGGPAVLDAIRTATWLGGAPRVIVPALPSAFIDAVQSGEEENGDGDAVATELAAVDPAAAFPGAAADAVSLEHAAPFSSSPLTSGLPHAVTPAAALPALAPAPMLPPGVTVADHGADVLVGVGTRAYRVRGLDRARADALRVNLRLVVRVVGPGAQPVDRVHVDTIDLYQARQRAAFAAAAAAEIGMAVDVLRDDLGAVLLAAEVVMHQHSSTAALAAAAAPGPAADATAPTITAEEEAAARALLMSPDVLDQIAADLGRCGLVGEERNKRAAMLACVSRLTDQPLAVLVQSTSAAGKTTLMDAVLSFLPESAVRRYSAMSGKSAFYLGSTPIKHRVLAIAEEEGARRASYALKLLQSDGKLTMAATGKDPDSGRLVTHDYTVEGPVMLFLTTTAIDLDPELVNRCLVLAVDESPEQTAAIHAAQRDARTLAGLTAGAERAAIRRRHQHAQALLKSYPVILPPDTRFHFAATSSRLRRDHQKFLNLISAVTLLHQFQRTPRTIAGPDGSTITYLEATPADIAMAADVAATVLPRTLDDLPPQTRRLWDLLRGHVAAAAERSGVDPARITLQRRQVQELAGWSYKQVRTHLDRLVEQEYVLATGGGHGQVVAYRIVPGIDDDGPASPVGGLADMPTQAHAPTPMTVSLPGNCPPIAHPGRAIENHGEISSERTHNGGLPGSPVRTSGRPHAVDSSHMQADPMDDVDAAPVPARAAG